MESNARKVNDNLLQTKTLTLYSESTPNLNVSIYVNLQQSFILLNSSRKVEYDEMSS